jgi:hypothetical protein
MRRALLFIALFCCATATAGAAPVKVPSLIFPVVGTVHYIDDFGAPRGTMRHQGNDLMADKKSPAVATEAGTVEFWTTSSHAGCMLYLRGDSGTVYWYIHLNNDKTMANDNKGKCVAGTAYAPGLKSGDHVEAGELVGYVGDSGDANGIASHLHFEIHPNGNDAVSPYKYLKRATPLLFYARPWKTVSLALNGTVVKSENGTLQLRLTDVSVVGTKKTNTVTRTIALSVAGGVPVSSLKAGLKATVYTEPTSATLEAQRGDADALVVSRIVPA